MTGDAESSSTAIDEATGRPFKPTPYPRASGAPLQYHPKPPRTAAQRSKVAGKTVLVLLSVAALVATGIGWGTVNWLRHNTNNADVILGGPEADDPAAPPPPPADDGAEDILLVGSDSRTDAQGNPLPLSVLKQLRTESTTGTNTDTMIILRIPKNGGKAQAVSIPRDSYVDIPGKGMDKINSAYGFARGAEERQLRADGDTDQRDIELKSRQAGARKLIQTVQLLTNVRIDHYAEVNLYGFYLLSQAVGGVPVCLKHATTDKDSGADFHAGWQTVSGGQALSFVRQRKNLPHGDLDRIVRQQTFLAAAANQVLSAGTLTNPGKLAGLVDTVHKSMLLDNGMDILSFIQQAQKLTGGDVTFSTIPVTSINGRDGRGQSIVTVDPARVRAFVASLVTAHPQPDPVVPRGAAPPKVLMGPPGGTGPAAVVAAARSVDLSSPKCVD